MNGDLLSIHENNAPISTTDTISLTFMIISVFSPFQKPIVMRMRVDYKIDGKDVLEQGEINSFPRELESVKVFVPIFIYIYIYTHNEIRNSFR